MRKLFSSGNVFTASESTVGGGCPVWYEIGKELSGGFNPDLSKFPKGSVVQTGTPIKVDEVARTAQLHIAVKVHQTAASGDTTVRISKLKAGSVLTPGQFLIVAPTAIAGTGTGMTVSAVDSSNPDYDTITLGAALSAELTGGTILIEADKAGAGAVIKVVPNALSRYDIYNDPDAFAFSVGVVVEGTIYERRIPPVAEPVQALFQKEITFSKSK